MNPRTSVSSRKCERLPAIQSSAGEEWWIEWNRHCTRQIVWLGKSRASLCDADQIKTFGTERARDVRACKWSGVVLRHNRAFDRALAQEAAAVTAVLRDGAVADMQSALEIRYAATITA